MPSQNTHQQVKAKVFERMGEWSDMFARNTDLGIMGQAYQKLKALSELSPDARLQSSKLTGPKIRTYTLLRNPERAR